MQQNPGLPIAAAFDFDGTLTYHDSLIPFLVYFRGYFRTSWDCALALPQLAGCLVDELNRQSAKEAILTSSIRGMSMESLCLKGKEFAGGPLQKIIKPEGMKKLFWHQQQGHRCILISANLDVYLKPWSLQSGFHDLICSELASDGNGCATGKLKGLNCRGKEKTRRLLTLMGPKNHFILYAYGDSKGDQELLEMADYPFYRCF